MPNFAAMVCSLRESRNQTSTVTSRSRIYSSDDALNEDRLPLTLTMSEASHQGERVEEKGTTYPTEIPKQDSTTVVKREDPLPAVIQLPSKSPMEEQRPAPLSAQRSLTTQMESTRVSASLPRSYQKTDTARLTSVVTPRPFGSHSRGISSLPRSYTVKTCSQFIYSILMSKLLLYLCRRLSYVYLICTMYITCITQFLF